jgi:amino acid transporter
MADINKCELTVTMDQQVSRVEEGVTDTSVFEDEGWKRGLSPRAVVMLSLGGGIGLGLWIGTGTALEAGECDRRHTLQS